MGFPAFPVQMVTDSIARSPLNIRPANPGGWCFTRRELAPWADSGSEELNRGGWRRIFGPCFRTHVGRREEPCVYRLLTELVCADGFLLWPRLSVQIAGDGPCAPMLHELSRDLKLDGTVEWLGDVSRSQLLAAYNRSDIFCLPSVQEGFGIVLLEAMAAGKPVVAARAGAIPEVAPHGTLVEPDSPEALAAGIEALYRSPQSRSAQVQAGSRWVGQFDAALVARRFLEAAGRRCLTAAKS